MFGNLFKKSFDSITVEEFKTKMKEKNTVIVDVRRADEVASGKIKGAMNIDVMSRDFQQKIGKLDASKTYLVYCRSGQRSKMACKQMKKAGLDNLYDLSGGIMAWNRQK